MQADPSAKSDDVAADEELSVGGAVRLPTIRLLGLRVRADRFWMVIAVAALLGLLVTALTSSWRTAGHGSTAPTAAPTAGPTAAPVVSPTPFDRVLALAHDPLVNHVRQSSPTGSCVPVTVGYSPERTVLRVIRSIVGHAKVTDSDRTLDQFTGLCALDLRASAAHGVIVTVEISAPPPRPAARTFDATEVGVETSGAVTTKYALQTWHDGWIVLIGAVGPMSALPGERDMSNAAATRGLLW